MDDHPLLGPLLSSGPDPESVEELALFGQFVGSWDLEVRWHEPDGSVVRADGEWHFGWVLAGRVIQDVWIVPRRGSPKVPDADRGDYGTSVRFFDRRIRAWRSTWIGPQRGSVRPFLATARVDEIVLEGRHDAGVLTQWIFSEISPTAFRWRSQDSTDEGRSWRLVQEFLAERRPSRG